MTRPNSLNGLSGLRQALASGTKLDWAGELDFVGPRVRPASWSWLLLLAGCAAVVGVMPKVSDAEAAKQAEQDAVKRLQRATHQHELKQLAAERGGKGRGAAGLKPEAQAQAARLARTLAYPWLPLFSKVEETARSRQVVLLSFSLDLSSMDARAVSGPEARIGAAVMDDAQALAWVQAHGSPAQLLGRERLTAPLVTQAGTYGWRADALLDGGRP